MANLAHELAHRLAEDVEAVCRTYLSNGRRAGNHWIVGDVRNSPGRSMHVRLKENAQGAAGKWVDEATGEHGDLLDVIAHSCGLVGFRDVVEEARRFLSLPRAEPHRAPTPVCTPVPAGSPEAAQRLFAMAKPIAGTLAQRYLARRGIALAPCERAVRFHPGCYYRDLATGETLVLPALIAAVTDLEGRITGLQRTWLDPDGDGKARVADPRRSLGHLLGNAIWLGRRPVTIMAAGEGFETMASLSTVMPLLPVAAATSANHLASLVLPPGCRRLYIAADADAAGRHGIERLSRCAGAAGVASFVLRPRLGDFNDDLRSLGPDRLVASLREQFVADDAGRLLPPR